MAATSVSFRRQKLEVSVYQDVRCKYTEVVSRRAWRWIHVEWPWLSPEGETSDGSSLISVCAWASATLWVCQHSPSSAVVPADGQLPLKCDKHILFLAKPLHLNHIYFSIFFCTIKTEVNTKATLLQSTVSVLFSYILTLYWVLCDKISKRSCNKKMMIVSIANKIPFSTDITAILFLIPSGGKSSQILYLSKSRNTTVQKYSITC